MCRFKCALQAVDSVLALWHANSLYSRVVNNFAHSWQLQVQEIVTIVKKKLQNGKRISREKEKVRERERLGRKWKNTKKIPIFLQIIELCQTRKEKVRHISAHIYVVTFYPVEKGQETEVNISNGVEIRVTKSILISYS